MTQVTGQYFCFQNRNTPQFCRCIEEIQNDMLPQYVGCKWLTRRTDGKYLRNQNKKDKMEITSLRWSQLPDKQVISVTAESYMPFRLHQLLFYLSFSQTVNKYENWLLILLRVCFN
jgi:hypothetical protein